MEDHLYEHLEWSPPPSKPIVRVGQELCPICLNPNEVFDTVTDLVSHMRYHHYDEHTNNSYVVSLAFLLPIIPAFSFRKCVVMIDFSNISRAIDTGEDNDVYYAGDDGISDLGSVDIDNKTVGLESQYLVLV